MRLAVGPLLVLLLALAGCGAKRIPGTDLEDTGDTRAIIDVIARYNAALDARDANGILAVVDPSFYDDAGTLIPDDDLDIQRLRTTIPQRLARLNDMAVRIDIKTIDVKGDRASVVYTWVSVYKLAGKTLTESDIKRMILKSGPEGWKIVSGI